MKKLSKNRKILLSVIGILLLFSIIIAINFIFRNNHSEPEDHVLIEKEAEESTPQEDPIENEDQPNGPIEELPKEEPEPAKSETIVEDTDLN